MANDQRRAAARKVNMIWLAAALAAAGGCATQEAKVGDKPVPVERVFAAPFEDVERALKQAMIRYPPKVDNSEAGIFETDYVKGDARFKPPFKETHYTNGFKYRLFVRLVRGRGDGGQPAVKVVVTKAPELTRDFFSSPELLGSDGLEEGVILYRIGRELAVDRAIHRAQDKTNKQTN